MSARYLLAARGLFVSFEGGEGGGKSTQVARLARRLRAEHWDTVTAREPGGTELGERVREITRDPAAPLAELFLFEAARAQLVAELVRPALAAGAIVILDRYADSTLAYQGHGRGLDLNELRQVNTIATGGLTPDLTFLLDLDVERGLQRKLGEIGHDTIGRAHRAFHERVRIGYRELATAEPLRWLILDATLPPEALEERIWTAVQERLAARPIARRPERAWNAGTGGESDGT